VEHLTNWLSRMRGTVELGLGFAQTRKTRPFGHDGQLARLLEQRNAVRRRRSEQEDDVKRATLQVELRELQKKVKTRLSLLRNQSINSRNAVLLKCKSRNPSVYSIIGKYLSEQWDLIVRRRCKSLAKFYSTEW